MTSFANLLRDTRKRVGLTQEVLADKVGVDDSYISRIERGLYPPPGRDKVIAIADTLRITDKAELFDFLLAAGCASQEDKEAASQETRQRQPGNLGERHTRQSEFAASGVYGAPLSLGQPPQKRITEDDKIRQMLDDAELPYPEYVKAQRLIEEAARTIIRVLKEELEK